MVAGWFIPYTHIKFVLLAVPLWAVFMLGSGIVLAWRGIRIAKIFLAAWFFLIFGALVNTLASLGLLPVNGLTANAPQIGSLIEFIMLSFALSDRIQTLQKNLLQSEKEINLQHQKMEHELENLVNTRTQELRYANHEMIMAYSSVEHQRAQAIEAGQQAERSKMQTEVALERLNDSHNALSKLMLELKFANDQLQIFANTDGLTKVYNRAFFDKSSEEELRRVQRTKVPLSLIILDIDFFKKINDTYGHPGGDACLRAMANTLTLKIQRVGDILARFGGEEFVILLPDCNLQNAVTMAETLRKDVEKIIVPFEGQSIQFTASFGVACGLPEDTFTIVNLLASADKALYQAKGSGRNCVISSAIVTDHMA